MRPLSRRQVIAGGAAGLTGWPRGLHPHAAGGPARMSRAGWRPPVPPIGLYRRVDRGPISDGVRQVTLDFSGAGQASAGPQGLGSLWWPSSVQVSTGSGTLDNSVVQLYAGPLAAPVLLSGQSYAGGGDTIGLAGVELQVGEFLIVAWAGGMANDLATMRVQGVQECLSL